MLGFALGIVLFERLGWVRFNVGVKALKMSRVGSRGTGDLFLSLFLAKKNCFVKFGGREAVMCINWGLCSACFVHYCYFFISGNSGKSL